MKVAALDLGSNTFLLLIAEVEGQKIRRVELDEARVVRLGQGVNQTRRFHPEALKRVEQCFKEFSGLINNYQVEKVTAVATSAARDVKNREEFLELGRRFGIPIQVVAGELEAELTFKGALSDQPTDNTVAVIDVGGGSTEVIIGTQQSIHGQSLDVGSVRLTEMFVSTHPIPDADLEQMIAFTQNEFTSLMPRSADKVEEVIAVAGTPTTLACVIESRDFAEDWVNGYLLTQSTLRDWIKKLASMSVEQRQALKGMPPKRADVIVAGAVCLLAAMETLGQQQVRVSTRGVRYGVAMQAESL